MHIPNSLLSLHPCSEAVQWLKSLPNNTTKLEAWQQCPKGSWILWRIGKAITSKPWSEDRKPLLACCLDCAEAVKHLWPKAQADKIKQAITTLRDWIAGTANVAQAKAARQQLRNAAAAYDAAAYAASSAAYAAYAAAAAAYATYAAAAAAAAAYAAYAAYATYAAAAAAAAAETNIEKQCAAIVLQHFPNPPFLAETT